jgi:hypothetical protein
LIKKWIFLSLAHPIGHSPPATPEAGASNKLSERNNTVCQIGSDVKQVILKVERSLPDDY